jgi:hypothetical protein
MHIVSATRLFFGLNSPTSAVAFGMMQPSPIPEMKRSCWLVHVAGEASSDREHGKEQRGTDEHRTPAYFVRKHAKQQRAEQNSEVRGRENARLRQR